MYKDFVSLSSSQYDQNPDFSNVFVYHWHSIMEEDEEEWFSEDLKKSYFLQLASQYKQGSFFSILAKHSNSCRDFFKFDYGKKRMQTKLLIQIAIHCCVSLYDD